MLELGRMWAWIWEGSEKDPEDLDRSLGRIWERSREDLSGTRCLFADCSLRELLAERSFPASYLLLAQRAFTLSLATQILCFSSSCFVRSGPPGPPSRQPSGRKGDLASRICCK